MLRAGFIGMGRMGKLMASRLEGHCAVSGTDVIPSVKDGVEAAGIAWCDSIQELTRCSDVIFVVVGSEDDVTSVIFDAEGVLASADTPKILVVCATVRPSYMQALSERISRESLIRLLDCPLARGESAAANGELLIFVGGDKTVLSEVEPMLQRLASDIEWLGPPGSGQVGKMINNYLLWSCLTASVEGLDLGERFGVDREKLRMVLEKSSGANWAMSTRADERPALWAEKDMALFLQEADRVRMPVPIAGQIRESIKAFKLGRDLPKAPTGHDYLFPD